jgi:hypothetical protein
MRLGAHTGLAELLANAVHIAVPDDRVWGANTAPKLATLTAG